VLLKDTSCEWRSLSKFSLIDSGVMGGMFVFVELMIPIVVLVTRESAVRHSSTIQIRIEFKSSLKRSQLSTKLHLLSSFVSSALKMRRLLSETWGGRERTSNVGPCDAT
jgi:hypothetical protein